MTPKHAVALCACITLGLGLMGGCTDRQATAVEGPDRPTSKAVSSTLADERSSLRAWSRVSAARSRKIPK